MEIVGITAMFGGVIAGMAAVGLAASWAEAGVVFGFFTPGFDWTLIGSLQFFFVLELENTMSVKGCSCRAATPATELTWTRAVMVEAVAGSAARMIVEDVDAESVVEAEGSSAEDVSAAMNVFEILSDMAAGITPVFSCCRAC